MKDLTIEQYCQLENLKNDLHLGSSYHCQQKVKDNLTVLEVSDSQGNVLRELIVVL